MMRIGLFLLTNIAVMVVLGIVMSIFNLGGAFGQGGLNYTSLMVMCFAYGMMGSMISLFLSKGLAKKSMGVQLIDNPSSALDKWLVDTVAKQAKSVNIDMPEVGIFDSPQPNAFATGWNKNAALVAVSTGLLQTMTPEEVEAVLAHEIGHVANGDMVTLALIQGVVNAFVMFFARVIGYFVDQLVFKNESDSPDSPDSPGNESDSPGMGYFITSMVMDIMLGFLATAIVMWFSRVREFRADEMGAKLAGKQNMIAALNALRPASQQPDPMPESMKAFAIASGQQQSFSIAQLFRSHPTLDDRITALTKLK